MYGFQLGRTALLVLENGSKSLVHNLHQFLMTRMVETERA